MIRITCTNCNTVLSIDDAFAGGVCRCQHCGTIQTVPAHLKSSAECAQPVAAGDTGSKTLYQNKARGGVPAGSGSGLDDLAGIVASSGLSDNRLQKNPQAGIFQKNPRLLLAIAAGVIVLLIVVVIVLLSHGGKTEPSSSQTPPADAPSGAFGKNGPGSVIEDAPPPAVAPDNPSPAQQPAPQAAAGPSFCGVKLASNTVVYLIDNGSSSARILDYVKDTVYQSAQSLGSNRQFEIIFWNSDSPTFGPAAATPANIELARTKLEDVVAAGSTDATDGVKKALAANPGEIVLITAKGLEIEDAAADAVIAARGASPVKIHVIDISGTTGDTAASSIATKTGGTFAPISERDIKAGN